MLKDARSGTSGKSEFHVKRKYITRQSSQGARNRLIRVKNNNNNNCSRNSKNNNNNHSNNHNNIISNNNRSNISNKNNNNENINNNNSSNNTCNKSNNVKEACKESGKGDVISNVKAVEINEPKNGHIHPVIHSKLVPQSDLKTVIHHSVTHVKAPVFKYSKCRTCRIPCSREFFKEREFEINVRKINCFKRDNCNQSTEEENENKDADVGEASGKLVCQANGFDDDEVHHMKTGVFCVNKGHNDLKNKGIFDLNGDVHQLMNDEGDDLDKINIDVNCGYLMNNREDVQINREHAIKKKVLDLNNGDSGFAYNDINNLKNVVCDLMDRDSNVISDEVHIINNGNIASHDEDNDFSDVASHDGDNNFSDAAGNLKVVSDFRIDQPLTSIIHEENSFSLVLRSHKHNKRNDIAKYTDLNGLVNEAKNNSKCAPKLNGQFKSTSCDYVIHNTNSCVMTPSNSDVSCESLKLDESDCCETLHMKGTNLTSSNDILVNTVNVSKGNIVGCEDKDNDSTSSERCISSNLVCENQCPPCKNNMDKKKRMLPSPSVVRNGINASVDDGAGHSKRKKRVSRSPKSVKKDAHKENHFTSSSLLEDESEKKLQGCGCGITISDLPECYVDMNRNISSEHCRKRNIIHNRKHVRLKDPPVECIDTSSDSSDTLLEKDAFTSSVSSDTLLEKNVFTSSVSSDTLLEKDAFTSSVSSDTLLEKNVFTSSVSSDTLLEKNVFTSSVSSDTLLEKDAFTSSDSSDTLLEKYAFSSSDSSDNLLEKYVFTSSDSSDTVLENDPFTSSDSSDTLLEKDTFTSYVYETTRRLKFLHNHFYASVFKYDNDILQTMVDNIGEEIDILDEDDDEDRNISDTDDNCMKNKKNSCTPSKDPSFLVSKCEWGECDLHFKDSTKLLDHLQRSHINDLSDGTIFCCLWRKCKFSNQPSSYKWLSNHILRHCSVRPFKCVILGCELSFATQNGLARHVPSHFNEGKVRRTCVNTGVSKGQENGRRSRLDVSSNVMDNAEENDEFSEPIRKRTKYEKFVDRYKASRSVNNNVCNVFNNIKYKLQLSSYNSSLNCGYVGSYFRFNHKVIGKRTSKDGSTEMLLSPSSTKMFPYKSFWFDGKTLAKQKSLYVDISVNDLSDDMKQHIYDNDQISRSNGKEKRGM